MSLPTLINRQAVHERLQQIFPEGTPHRGYCTRELAASTVFTALYIGAIEGTGVFLAPKHVYRMTEEQAARTSDADRAAYERDTMKPGFEAPGQRWYRDNTRESIRDETLREGLVALGAVIERTNLPTTSSKPRYALTESFADLFDANHTDDALEEKIVAWRSSALAPGALARIAIVRKGAATGGDHVTVAFPNGETRRLKPGPSSEITKAVVEVFAKRFLQKPAVLFISESGNKVVSRDDELAKAIGIDIKADKNLPDAILVDLGPAHPLIVFIEIVATDGPINERRKQALEDLAKGAKFPLDHVAFLTAYLDRSGAPFKKTVDTLAWGSYAWFVSEPEGVVQLSLSATGLR